MDNGSNYNYESADYKRYIFTYLKNCDKFKLIKQFESFIVMKG